MVGDSFKGRRIVGTSPQMFCVDDEGKPVQGEPFHYRQDRAYEMAQGRAFAPRKFEAVIGSDIAATLGLHLYDDKLTPEQNEQNGGAFRATHGMPGPNEKPDIHKPRWKIVGILKPTHTANDRVLFIPFISLYAIAEHEEGMIDQALMRANIDPSRIPPDRVDDVLAKLGIDPSKVPETVRRKFKMKPLTTNPAIATAPKDVDELIKAATVAPEPAKEDEGEDPDAYHLDAQGNIIPDLPPEEWSISAILVQSRGGVQAQQLMYNFKVIDDRATAVNPASVMRGFFDTFLSGTTKVLLLISAFVTVVAAASIMTTIYNSVAARRREIAILRALGATRRKILTLICAEATLIGLVGGIAGFVAGHLLSAVGSTYLRESIGEGIDWIKFGPGEIWYLIAVVALAFFAGLVPALKAYSTPVASHLASS
jgi:putative ABC transport system permease protein